MNLDLMKLLPPFIASSLFEDLISEKCKDNLPI